MSKYKTKEVWIKYYGNKEEVFDYAGRLMKKSACGNPKSRFFPTLDHVRPISNGGHDVIENIVICHRDTNVEKGYKFPHWKTNNFCFHAERKKGTKVGYKIIKD